PVHFYWVKGHSKDEHNKAVDKAAKASAKAPLNAPLTRVNVRRKHTTRPLSRGSVEMMGQRITIRIVTSEWLPIQRLWKYRYEVVSKASRFRGNIDFIYSRLHLGAGHTYYVLFNSDAANPQVEKLFRETKPKQRITGQD
ncbi:MAG TPA: hypothetical protein PK634_06065, partial [Kiritimatiellia bacterium]|nr:hypothetical protein [Kiritimatiellia bacterium]